jgi:hypothetical protein
VTVSRVQGLTIDNANSQSQGVSITFTAGNLGSAGVKAGATGNTLGCSDPTNTWTGIDIANTADVSDEEGSFYAANVAGSTVTVTITSSVAGHSLRGIIEEYSGCATSSPLNDHGTGGGTNALSGSAVTGGSTTNSGDLVVGWTSIASAETTDTKGASYAVGSDITVGRLASQWKAATASGSQTADYSWTAVNSNWMANIATFKAGAAATPYIPTPDPIFVHRHL